MDELERFARTVTGPDLDLGEALALIAAHGRPQVGTDAVVGRLDQLADGCAAHDTAGLCASLFGPNGFDGDTADYHDPRNSLLDQVLARRRGIPITLSVLAMEVGRRRGIGVLGIGMPGHFLVRDALDPEAFYDPFDGGQGLDRVSCRRIFGELHGPAAAFEESFLDPVPATAIVTRVLANLHRAYVLRSDRSGVVRVLQLQSRLPQVGLLERRTLADLLAAEGRFDEAADLHDELAAIDPDPDQEHALRALRLRARLN